ncbi:MULTISPECIES: hypothetical protein [unclassified Sphingomonas]|uniref:hypothetical protein n=1 Tax=unclassified Sphingomonas TaxID=196159 RepID=UPI001D11CE83|nr:MULTISPECIES: hypothetical protein [unclassified Sphingomonas]MCC2980893.1 hypothetical protein [Sphingomonas sp. IC4-52]MCD2317377.1 hypothetical protein [Sphingomonas sp. IC-11]
MESKDERDARRAAALRANLRRRKAQARGTAGAPASDGEAHPPESSGTPAE